MAAWLGRVGSTLVTILASVLVFGSVILIHELGHFLTAKFSGIRVNEFALGMGPRLFHFTKGETTYALRLFPVGGFVSMEGEDDESDDPASFTHAPVGNRILVTAAGAVMNLLLGFLVLIGIVCSQDLISTRTVLQFHEGASTQQTGLREGDTIVAVNGRRCFTANDIIYEFARTQQGTADMTVLRDGKRVDLRGVTFETHDNNGTPQLIIDFVVLGEKKTFTGVLREAGLWSLSLGRMIVLSLTDLLTGRIAINNLSGPVGIVSAIGEATSAGLQPLFMLLALITINLGIFNLLPVPALDGGRLVFLLLEAIRRRPVPQKYESFVNAVGFIFLIGVMIFATFNDVTKLVFH